MSAFTSRAAALMLAALAVTAVAGFAPAADAATQATQFAAKSVDQAGDAIDTPREFDREGSSQRRGRGRP